MVLLSRRNRSKSVHERIKPARDIPTGLASASAYWLAGVDEKEAEKSELRLLKSVFLLS